MKNLAKLELLMLRYKMDTDGFPIYTRMTFGDIMPISNHVEIPEWKSCNNPIQIKSSGWFYNYEQRVEDEEKNMDLKQVVKILDNFNVNRDGIPFKSVKDFVDATRGKVIGNSGIIINKNPCNSNCSVDTNACGLISLYGSKVWESMCSCRLRRNLLNNFDSKEYGIRIGEILSEDQLSYLAKQNKIKIYFLHSHLGNMSVLVMGDEKGKNVRIIHSTGNHFEEIKYE